MKEFIYTYIHGNYYLSNLKSQAAFDGETQVLLIIKPHDFEMKLSGEILRKSSCKGYTAEITNKGAVRFFDIEGNLVVNSEETCIEHKEFSVNWKDGILTLGFGHMETIDNYPNCDGESDRYDTIWVTKHKVELNTLTNQLV